MILSTEAGVDTATRLLKHYNKTSGWSLPKSGPFWQAVGGAHDAGHLGEGRTIAVLEAGFDPELVDPALCVWDAPDLGDQTAKHYAHGAAVVLLIAEVAPKAKLLLYPTGHKRALIEAALEDATDRRADIINLSFGIPTKLEKIYDVNAFFRPMPEDPHRTQDDVFFLQSAHMGQRRSWRDFVPAQAEWLDVAAAQCAKQGATVIVAVGNSKDHVNSPAGAEGVFSIGYKQIRRTINDDGVDLAQGGGPSFSQSLMTDFTITQPEDALGSSFAAPLMSGFAALLPDREMMRAYAAIHHFGSLADELVRRRVQLEPGWTEERDGVIESLYHSLLRSLPHDHFAENPTAPLPCPFCAYFAATAITNFGLHLLHGNALEHARTILTISYNIAPDNLDTAANLAVTLAHFAYAAQTQGQRQEAVKLLTQAEQLMSYAARERPENPHFRARASEFADALTDPARWADRF